MRHLFVILVGLLVLIGCSRKQTQRGEHFVEYTLKGERQSTIVCKYITVWPEEAGKYGMEFDGYHLQTVTVHGVTDVEISDIPASEGHPCQLKD